MHRIDGLYAVLNIPAAETPGAVVGYFNPGDPQTGVPATNFSPYWLNAVQEELVAVIAAAGIALDKATRTQLRDAIQKLNNGGSGGVTAIVFANSPYGLVSTKKIVPVDTSGGAVSVVLPAAADVPGEEWHIGKVTADANLVTLTGTIQGEVNPTIGDQWTFRKIRSLGALGWIWS